MSFFSKKLSHFASVFLLVFCMINLKSICKAYTFEQFEQFLQAVYDNNLTSRAYNHYDAKYVLDNWYKIENAITSNNVDVSQYDSFGIYANGTSVSNITEVSVFMFKKNTYLNYVNDGNNQGFISFRGQGIYVISTGFKYDFSDGWNTHKLRCGLFNVNPANSNDIPALRQYCVTQYNWDPNDHPLIPPFSFTPYGILASGDWYYQKFSYTGNIGLGELGDNEFYQLDIKLNNPNGVKLGVISIVPDVRRYR